MHFSSSVKILSKAMICAVALLAGVVIFDGRLLRGAASPAAESDDHDSPVGPSTVSAFLDSLGICIHHAQGVPMQSYIAPLRYIGLKNVRDDFGNDTQSYINLYQAIGVRVSLIARAEPMDHNINRLRQIAQAGALLSIEGPNEPNNFPIVYNGKKGGGSGLSADWTSVAEFQRDLYAAVKKDDVLSALPVLGPSEVGAEHPNVGLQFKALDESSGTAFPAGTKFYDFANVHNYVSSNKNVYVDNQAWQAADPLLNSYWDGLFGNHGVTWGFKYKGYPDAALAQLPRMTTETGWDSKKNPGGERVQGIIILNTLFAQFKRDWSRTFIYMLRDGEGGVENQGVFNADSTPKLAATYLHNLTRILAPDGVTLASDLAAYRITGRQNTVHDFSLKAADGSRILVIWNERVEGGNPITIDFGQVKSDVRAFDPVQGVDAIATYQAVEKITYTIKDQPLILKVSSPKR
ncbi:hypothetical protein SAMN05216360_11812 [Methylobacterium phyllostachyos]|uniref:Glycosyl hydrolase catalytic core n=1 Tax=Methylobacterium phyllostachyos TaxID=582672 RepID=A0A1H0I550_9HYPH|nr:glycosyl hydrolase [Methylobacterium phyllostachyos]SDO26536.1 hypothetical protein SAMN05216360_11812 [Methylobacterium phyllostachyos]